MMDREIDRNLLQLTGNNSAFESMAIFVQFPCTPLAKFATKYGRVHIQHIVFHKPQFAFIQISGPIESGSNVKRITRLIFDLIEFCFGDED